MQHQNSKKFKDREMMQIIEWVGISKSSARK
jgi:hypothetical protein